MSEFTFERNFGAPERAQAQTVKNMRHDAAIADYERWKVYGPEGHQYDLWLANGSGNLFAANRPSLSTPCIKQGVWDHRGSDASARIDRLVDDLQRGWDRRE